LEEAEIAVSEGADALGLVGAMPSGPGVISDDTISKIARQVPPGVSTFLLTSEISGEAISEHALRTGVDTVQIVTHIDPVEYRRLIADAPNIRRVQVIHVQDEDALQLMDLYEPYVHAFLLDSGSPSAPVPLLGGTGRMHDWSISARFVQKSRKPVYLAGGLSAENVADAISTVKPFGLDICSNLRSQGKLDRAKLRNYIKAARTAEL
jgi:phosphoribosylanthranilate isomerase